MESIILMTVIATLAVVFLYVKTAMHSGWKPSEVKRYFTEGDGRNAHKDIIAVILAVILLGSLLTAGYKAFASEPEWDYLRETTIFVGLDYDIHNKVFCEPSGADDRLTSNVGVRQHLISRDNVSANLQYTHHSCALNRDAPTYDAVGIIFEWKFTR